MGQHSSIVGGSTAERVINCPASILEISRLPPSAEPPSSYAAEGSLMHSVMERMLDDPELSQPDNFLNTVVDGETISRDHIETMIRPADAALTELCEIYGLTMVHAIEETLPFPGIPGVFGTIDVIAIGNGVTAIADYKFGAGVPVRASYLDADGSELLNSQGMFYLCCARAKHPELFNNKIVMAFIQPRFEGNELTHTVVTREELDQFEQILRDSLFQALAPDPRRLRGEWCRFAPCKVTCPLFTGPLLDLAKLDPVKAAFNAAAKGPETTDYGRYLSEAKRTIDLVKPIIAAIEEQVHSFLEAGGEVPGYKLKHAQADRAWLPDAKKVARKLRRLGIEMTSIWRPRQLQTFKVVDAAAKRLGVEIPEDLRPRPPTTKTTVTESSDPAPAVAPPVQLQQFAQTLAALRGAQETGNQKGTKHE